MKIDILKCSTAEYHAISRANQRCYYIRHSILWETAAVSFETNEEKNQCLVWIDTRQVYGTNKSNKIYHHQVLVDMYTNEVMSSIDIDFAALPWWSRAWHNIKEVYIEWIRPVRDRDYEPIYDLHGTRLSR